MQQKNFTHKYTVAYPVIRINHSTGKKEREFDEIPVPDGHSGKLEEIVTECLRCHREVNIMHETNQSIRFRVFKIKPADLGNLTPPPFQEDLLDIENSSMTALAVNLEDVFGITGIPYVTTANLITYVYRKSENGAYEWQKRVRG